MKKLLKLIMLMALWIGALGGVSTISYATGVGDYNVSSEINKLDAKNTKSVKKQKPKKVKVINVTPTKVKVSWKKVYGAKKYCVTYYSNKSNVKKKYVKGTVVTLRGLKSNVKYTYYVQAIGKEKGKTVKSKKSAKVKKRTIKKENIKPQQDIEENSKNEEKLYKAYLNNQLQVQKLGKVSMSGTLYAKKDWTPEVVGDWLQAEGYIAADIFDYDGDGVKDMLLVTNGISPVVMGDDSYFHTTYEMFTIENGEVVQKDTISTMAFWGQHSTDDVWAVFNRVLIGDTCYLVYTNGSCTVLDESLAQVRYTVVQYDGKECKTVLEGISYGNSGSTAYWSFENGGNGDCIDLGRDEIETFKQLFKKKGIDIVMRYDEDYKEDYVVRNEDAVFIASMRIDAKIDGDMNEQDCTGIITYTVNDGTDLHSITP